MTASEKDFKKVLRDALQSVANMISTQVSVSGMNSASGELISETFEADGMEVDITVAYSAIPKLEEEEDDNEVEGEVQ